MVERWLKLNIATIALSQLGLGKKQLFHPKAAY